MVEKIFEWQNKVKRMKRTEDSLRDLWDNIKCTNIRIIGVPEEEEKQKGYEKIFEEIIVIIFPQHGKGNSQSSSRGAKSPLAGWSQRPTRSRSHALRRNAGPPPGGPVLRVCPRSGTSLIPQRSRKRPLSRIRQLEYL